MSPRVRKSDRRELPEFGAARGWARHRPRNRLSDTARRCKPTPFPSSYPFAARPLMADYVLGAFSPRRSLSAIDVFPDLSSVSAFAPVGTSNHIDGARDRLLE